MSRFFQAVVLVGAMAAFQESAQGQKKPDAYFNFLKDSYFPQSASEYLSAANDAYGQRDASRKAFETSKKIMQGDYAPDAFNYEWDNALFGLTVFASSDKERRDVFEKLKRYYVSDTAYGCEKKCQQVATSPDLDEKYDLQNSDTRARLTTPEALSNLFRGSKDPFAAELVDFLVKIVMRAPGAIPITQYSHGSAEADLREGQRSALRGLRNSLHPFALSALEEIKNSDGVNPFIKQVAAEHYEGLQHVLSAQKNSALQIKNP